MGRCRVSAEIPPASLSAPPPPETAFLRRACATRPSAAARWSASAWRGPVRHPSAHQAEFPNREALRAPRGLPPQRLLSVPAYPAQTAPGPPRHPARRENRARGQACPTAHPVPGHCGAGQAGGGPSLHPCVPQSPRPRQTVRNRTPVRRVGAGANLSPPPAGTLPRRDAWSNSALPCRIANTGHRSATTSCFRTRAMPSPSCRSRSSRLISHSRMTSASACKENRHDG